MSGVGQNNNPVWTVLSWILGLFDYGYLLLKLLGPLQPKFYRKGYGDTHRILELQIKTMKSLDGSDNLKLREDQLIWGGVKPMWGSITVQEGRFQSPLAQELPPEAAYAQFYLVKPKKGQAIQTKKQEEREAYIIMLPATGEADIFLRLWIARKLANQYGWSSLIVTAPYYGDRQPKDQTLFFVNTVEDTFLQAWAIIQETTALTSYLLDKSPSALVCLTGFSFGAAMAGNSVNVALQSGVDGQRLACAPYVGSSSPCVLADGLLESAIDWNALRKSNEESYTLTRQRLLTKFYETQMTSLTPERLQNPIRVVQGYNMMNDAFIQTKYAFEFEQHIQICLNQSFQMKWLPGGHVFAALARPFWHKKLIVEVVQELIHSRE